MLDQVRVDALRRAPFTYPDVGRSAGDAPAGYHRFVRTRTLPATHEFGAAAADLLSWRVQQSAGLRVSASSAEVEPGVVVLMRAGMGPATLVIPCRVVYVVDEPERQGFAYGTLPGHPESGEEAFVLQRMSDGRVVFTVSAFSRPATRLARLAGPAGRGLQRLVTSRYLYSLDR